MTAKVDHEIRTELATINTSYLDASGGISRVRRIVLGVDFSAASLAAASWVARYFAPHAELVLAHVAPRADLTSAALDRISEHEGEAASPTPALRGALYGLASVLGNDRVTTELREGEPVVELSRIADEKGADLIVLGSRIGTSSTFAASLLEHTTRPVLVARDPRPSAPATVLAAVGGESDAREILRGAQLIADSCNASIAALHVIDDELRELVQASRTPRAKRSRRQGKLSGLDAQVRSGVESWLERWLIRLNVARERSSTIITDGDPAVEVPAIARRMRSGIVAIGWAAVSAVTAGAEDANARSTWRRILSAARCSVLLVPRIAERLTSCGHRRVPGGGALRVFPAVGTCPCLT